ncbi:FUSC family protein [Nocardioides mangrovi]|uniref:FUSC family protein n=1 Tax=Nocardioides mangrovi TaxID=2874580 RepID=A0ABS7U7N2_9ACTN|nr:FUSC family protein [Nocardioides mangrovi]MBZ5736999.1 FUSC family protein [Nocardioides mangrovi]
MTPAVGAAVRSAAATMAVVLGALVTTLLLGQVTDVPAQASVLAVVLSLMLGRTAERGLHVGLETAAEVVVVSVAASGVAWLLLHARSLGEALLVVGLSIGILARRWSGVVRRAGRVVALPFLALLVTPVPVVAGGGSTGDLFVWSTVAALVAIAWAALTARFRSVDVAAERPPRAGRRRIDTPTRMAVQMFVGLAVALVVGRLLFDDRWAWCVLSAYVVASGNRGRGDVAHKAGLRVVGAVSGTVLATVGVLHVPPGERSTLVVLFVVMAVALVLRHWSYAFWAAGMTAMLSLLHAYYGSFGQSGAEQLRERMVGVLLGSAIGLAAAWWVLPVRTRDVFRARVADCLRAINDQDGSFPDALAALDQLAPTLRAGARSHPRARAQLAAVRALHELDQPPGGAVRRDVGRIRRSMVGRDDPAAEDLAPGLRPVLVALRP